MTEIGDQAPLPELPEAQYSGPSLGDVRDPAPLRDLIHGALDELSKLDAAAKQAEFDDALAAHRQLVDPELRGDRQVSDDELQAATKRLGDARAAVSRQYPPQPQ